MIERVYRTGENVKQAWIAVHKNKRTNDAGVGMNENPSVQSIYTNERDAALSYIDA